MAFVSVPKDLSKVKTKIALNLTKRQLICFSVAAVIGIPAYIITRGAIGNSAGALLMIAVMFPFFFLGIYEKDGMPAEKILRNIIRVRFMWPGRRPYIAENFYEIIQKEAIKNGDTPKIGDATKVKTTAKTPVGKRPSGKG
jgi:hypothetical protein